MLLLKLHDIPISPDSMAGTFSLSSLDASELFTSLQSMNEQEQQLMSNKQRISDTRLGVTAESDLTEEHLEILRFTLYIHNRSLFLSDYKLAIEKTEIVYMRRRRASKER